MCIICYMYIIIVCVCVCVVQVNRADGYVLVRGGLRPDVPSGTDVVTLSF